jgi:hypothetical protein
MEFPITLELEWFLQNILPPFSFCQIPLLDALLNYKTSTILEEWNPLSS